MKAILSMIVVSMWIVACGGDDDGIVDIGRSCSSAGECDHVCIVERGASVGQCSIECLVEADCPSFMDCITSSSTGERRCFDPGGLVVTSLIRLCEHACDDVDYFCSSSTITKVEADRCSDFCSAGSDAELESFIDCVGAEPRYTSVCPAATCVLDRI